MDHYTRFYHLNVLRKCIAYYGIDGTHKKTKVKTANMTKYNLDTKTSKNSNFKAYRINFHPNSLFAMAHLGHHTYI